MKYIYSLLFSCLSFSAFSQFYFNAGYSLGAPREQMATNIKPLHSVASGLTYRLPGCLGRIQGGIDFSWGSYANTRKEQTFNFGNGTSTVTWVNYSSNVIQAGLTGRVMLLQDKKIMPYISGRAGYASFYSNIYIEDPHDPGGCKALDQRNLIKDGTITGAYGGGMQFDWSLFSKRSNKGTRYIDISVNKTSGGKIDYINTKKLVDAGNPPVSSDGKPLKVKFINATTQQIHEHQVAEVYNTPLRMLDFKISTIFLLHRDR
ncbi:MAG: hypothetical protein H7Y01_12025 [Ferruginibacter sp.]|nr:hypothetical protein [Chitinophagaceae bacterium]